MKREKPKLIILCLMIFILSFSLAYAENGKKIYDKKCASCHGKDGKGNSAMVKMLKVDASLLDLLDKATLDKSDEELISIISKGMNKMPAYGKELKDEEIKGIITHIRSLSK
ncbi:MAG: hypothetical protein A2W77_05920 [Nitrospinae bacterium RIFCSPLOWO2_12_39_16]|nr:MAG: hypothetical protein A2W77_05920 [Nitrospinae bacterium RIFCSPLOWO2_12_39_16]